VTVLVGTRKEIYDNASFFVLYEGFILDIIVQENMGEGRMGICKRQKKL
jgi:hypothetical protein